MSLADDIIRAVEAGTDEGLLEAAHVVARLAIANMPVGDPAEDPNPAVALRENVHVTPHVGGVIVSVETPYAAKSEFDLRLNHPRSGGARYLQRAVAEIVPALDNIVASRVDARLAGGLASHPHRRHR